MRPILRLLCVPLLAGFHRAPAQSPSAEWREKTLAHAQAANAHEEKTRRAGSADAGSGPPARGWEHLAEPALAAVREANHSGNFAQLREAWPPCAEPLVKVLSEAAMPIRSVCILDDGSIVAGTGGLIFRPNGAGEMARRVFHLQDTTVTELQDTAEFACSANRRYFAFNRGDHIEITEGWRGLRVALCPWPTGKEDLPPGAAVLAWEKRPRLIGLAPFPDGRRALLVTGRGIFVLSPAGARRVFPSATQIAKMRAKVSQDRARKPFSIGLNAARAELSPDGKTIVASNSESSFFLYNDALELLAEVDPGDWEARLASFSASGKLIAFHGRRHAPAAPINRAAGQTIAAPLALLSGFQTLPSEPDARFPVLQREAEVEMALGRAGEFILATSDRQLRGISENGEPRWKQHVGHQVFCMDVSADGKTLAIGTHAGHLFIYKLDAAAPLPHQIATGPIQEIRRWLFLEGEKKPLAW